MDTCICTINSLCCVVEINTNYTPIKYTPIVSQLYSNKIFFKKAILNFVNSTWEDLHGVKCLDSNFCTLTLVTGYFRETNIFQKYIQHWMSALWQVHHVNTSWSHPNLLLIQKESDSFLPFRTQEQFYVVKSWQRFPLHNRWGEKNCIGFHLSNINPSKLAMAPE